PGFLEGILQKGQHALVLARLVEDALHQARWIECESNSFHRLDDRALQLGTWHRTEEDLSRRQKRSDLLMANQWIGEVGPHGCDDCNGCGSRCIQQQVDEPVDIDCVSGGSLPVTA